jgi:vacuolar-type H+-ATPase subunit E/Vma4
LDAEKDNLRKESNKHLAQLQLQQQRDLHKKQQQLKEEVFVLAEERVSEFMQTNDYIELLKKQLQEALNLAKGEDITLYIDPVDSDKKNMLEKHLDHDITLSERPFIGGSRGVIQSRKLLIDNSFLKRFEEEKANFSFDKAEEENAK